MEKENAGIVNISLETDRTFRFHNNVDFCVGTGRMGLALTEEYLKQLKLVQDEIGFKHIRGHGLFTDDMAIYHEYEEDGVTKVEYNYTYLDRVFDSYLKLNIRPFIELGFMPEKLASGTQTIFYWKGNTTPPKDYDMWADMVQALLRHLLFRYGRDEVISWPIEVWNEPNLPGFWEKADMQEYFKLFKKSFYAIKEVDKGFRVGGPAVCGGTDEIWIKAFMEFCHEEKIPVDFVTRHHYTSEFPKREGHYGYIELMKPEATFANLQTTRDIIDSFEEYKGLEIHVTEFNTSYIPNCPIHDTNENAAFLAQQLSRLGDVCETYSYWTFGDVFEEQGVPYTPFHGGFGLVANGNIPKPTFWTFAFYKALEAAGGECINKTDVSVVMKRPDGNYHGILWNHEACRPGKPADGKQETAKAEGETVTKTVAADTSVEFTITLPEGEWSLITKTVDEETCNPQKLWHDIGEPANPSEAQNKLLIQGAQPAIASARVNSEKQREITLTVKDNGVVYFSLEKNTITPDRGFCYERASHSDRS